MEALTNSTLSSADSQLLITLGTLGVIVFVFLAYVAQITELLCLVMLMYHFIKKSPVFCSGFYYILAVGYVIFVSTAIGTTLAILNELTDSQIELVMVLEECLDSYLVFFLGPWNTFMALYRFTAIFFWNKHLQFWRGIPIFGVIVFTLIYPFLIGGYFIINDPYCLIWQSIPKCQETKAELLRTQVISNGIHVGICAILGLSTALASKFKLVKLSTSSKKFEKSLIVQAIILTVLYLGYLLFLFTMTFIVDFKDHPLASWETAILFFISVAFTECYYTFFHLSATILLFFLSKPIIDNFCDFYRLNWCCKRKTRDSVTTIETYRK